MLSFPRLTIPSMKAVGVGHYLLVRRWLCGHRIFETWLLLNLFVLNSLLLLLVLVCVKSLVRRSSLSTEMVLGRLAGGEVKRKVIKAEKWNE